ncbi:MAG TPA: hypothetical protein VD838_01875 [Anaeromyxobacteraceae bacterium]|nr:hypothetical protein [Anaeromyxobacteraceae bacterium]
MKHANTKLGTMWPELGRLLLAASDAEAHYGPAAAVPDVRRAAVEALRRSYALEIEALAAKLRSRFESGELVPWSNGDDRW